MKKLLLCFIALGITGCAHKMDLLKVKDNFAMSSGMSQGMIDEVLKKAEAEHKSVSTSRETVLKLNKTTKAPV